ncbi:MAG: M20 family metallopeptidase [Eubacteriales bacterium]|nr:M20 family metallopeptidase [Eubacteriales bacterium]
MYENLLKEAKDLSAELVSWRRNLHQIPELDLSLPQTVAFVTSKLKEMDIPYQVIADGAGVVALIGKGDRCFMLRSDMDALPVEEESGVPFASKNGCMHACGHDLHTTILLGTAKILKAHESELKGVVKLLFQPGEETFRGAEKVLECGILENPHVDAAFAMHVGSTTPVGIIAYGDNPMSSVYGFKITISGRGGHGSTPEMCIDPINAGVQIYLALQALIARECPPSAEAALTIGQFAAGHASNVIPDKAVLQGTLRTFDPKVREDMIRRINEIVPAVAEAYRSKTEIEVLSNVPSVVCDKELNAEFAEVISGLDPALQVYPLFHAMGSEDFAFISEKLPNSAYFAIGAADPDQSKWYAQHNPKVLFNEDCLPIGVASYAAVAMNWLSKHA